MKIIQVLVAPDGSTKVETTGFSGSSCRQASEFLEHALGDRQSERLKAEFHQTACRNNCESNRSFVNAWRPNSRGWKLRWRAG